MHLLYYFLGIIGGLVAGAIIFGLLYLIYDLIRQQILKFKAKRNKELREHLLLYRQNKIERRQEQKKDGYNESTAINKLRQLAESNTNTSREIGTGGEKEYYVSRLTSTGEQFSIQNEPSDSNKRDNRENSQNILGNIRAKFFNKRDS